jgi:hypothetical protein
MDILTIIIVCLSILFGYILFKHYLENFHKTNKSRVVIAREVNTPIDNNIITITSTTIDNI